MNGEWKNARVEIVVQPSAYAKVPEPTATVLGVSEHDATAIAHGIAAAFILRAMGKGEFWCAYPQVRPMCVAIETADGTAEQAEHAVLLLREAADDVGIVSVSF